jgi:hypothetical protein
MLRVSIRVPLPSHHRIDDGWQTTTPAPSACDGHLDRQDRGLDHGQSDGRADQPADAASERDALGRPAARPPEIVEPLGLARVVLQLRVATFSRALITNNSAMIPMTMITAKMMALIGLLLAPAVPRRIRVALG